MDPVPAAPTTASTVASTNSSATAASIFVFGTKSTEYTFASLTLEVPNGPYFTFGSWGDEFTGDYVEVGYGFEWNGFDLSIALISSDDLVLSEVNQLAEYNLVFGISKGIAIGD